MIPSANPIQRVFEQAMQVGECPLWDPDKAQLYWVDIAGFAVHRLDPATGAHREWRMPAEPGCIAHNAAGGLIVAMRTGFFWLDTDDGSLHEIAAAPYDT